MVIVEDYLTKKRYFEDSEVNGWLLISNGEEVEMYYLYRRAWDEKNAVEIEENCYFEGEKLEGEEYEVNLQKIVEELNYLDKEKYAETIQFVLALVK